MGKRRNEFRLDIRDEALGRMRPELQIGIHVIHRAMMDWHMLIDRRAWEKETLARPNFTEIRQFFNSRWCASICRGCELMTPEHMLDLLERELAEAQKSRVPVVEAGKRRDRNGGRFVKRPYEKRFLWLLYHGGKVNTRNNDCL